MWICIWKWVRPLAECKIFHICENECEQKTSLFPIAVAEGKVPLGCLCQDMNTPTVTYTSMSYFGIFCQSQNLVGPVVIVRNFFFLFASVWNLKNFRNEHIWNHFFVAGYFNNFFVKFLF
jgi:hypothetical protein